MEACTHFVPHSWKYNKCRVCDKGEKDHATSAGLDPDVLLDHPELELPPHKRPGATPAVAAEPVAATPTPVPVAAAVDPVVRSPSPINIGIGAGGNNAAPSAGGCTHFVPHSWKYNKCRVCERGEKDHATSAGLDPDVLLDHPELELPPHLRPGATPTPAPISPTPSSVASPVASPTRSSVSMPPSSAAASIVSIPTAVVDTKTSSVSVEADNRRSSTITSTAPSSSDACTHFVPHAWKYNVCRKCSKNEKAHATSAGLDPDVLLDRPELELPPSQRDVPQPTPVVAAATATVTPPTPAPPPTPAVTATPATPSVTTTETAKPSTRASVTATPAKRGSLSAANSCDHFVPHAWKYNKCRVCDRGEKDHATSAGLDPDVLEEQPELAIPPSKRAGATPAASAPPPAAVVATPTPVVAAKTPAKVVAPPPPPPQPKAEPVVESSTSGVAAKRRAGGLTVNTNVDKTPDNTIGAQVDDTLIEKRASLPGSSPKTEPFGAASPSSSVTRLATTGELKPSTPRTLAAIARGPPSHTSLPAPPQSPPPETASSPVRAATHSIHTSPLTISPVAAVIAAEPAPPPTPVLGGKPGTVEPTKLETVAAPAPAPAPTTTSGGAVAAAAKKLAAASSSTSPSAAPAKTPSRLPPPLKGAASPSGPTSTAAGTATSSPPNQSGAPAKSRPPPVVTGSKVAIPANAGHSRQASRAPPTPPEPESPATPDLPDDLFSMDDDDSPKSNPTKRKISIPTTKPATVTPPVAAAAVTTPAKTSATTPSSPVTATVTTPSSAKKPADDDDDWDADDKPAAASPRSASAAFLKNSANIGKMFAAINGAPQATKEDEKKDEKPKLQPQKSAAFLARQSTISNLFGPAPAKATPSTPSTATTPVVTSSVKKSSVVNLNLALSTPWANEPSSPTTPAAADPYGDLGIPEMPMSLAEQAKKKAADDAAAAKKREDEMVATKAALAAPVVPSVVLPPPKKLVPPAALLAAFGGARSSQIAVPPPAEPTPQPTVTPVVPIQPVTAVATQPTPTPTPTPIPAAVVAAIPTPATVVVTPPPSTSATVLQPINESSTSTTTTAVEPIGGSLPPPRTGAAAAAAASAKKPSPRAQAFLANTAHTAIARQPVRPAGASTPTSSLVARTDLADTIPITVHISCKKLAQLDWMSVTSPIVAIFQEPSAAGVAAGNPPVMLDRTEWVRDSLDVTFTKPLIIEYKPLAKNTKQMRLLICVYDVREDGIDSKCLLGATSIGMEELARQPSSVTLPLENKNELPIDEGLRDAGSVITLTVTGNDSLFVDGKKPPATNDASSGSTSGAGAGAGRDRGESKSSRASSSSISATTSVTDDRKIARVEFSVACRHLPTDLPADIQPMVAMFLKEPLSAQLNFIGHTSRSVTGDRYNPLFDNRVTIDNVEDRRTHDFKCSVYDCNTKQLSDRHRIGSAAISLHELLSKPLGVATEYKLEHSSNGTRLTTAGSRLVITIHKLVTVRQAEIEAPVVFTPLVLRTCHMMAIGHEYNTYNDFGDVTRLSLFYRRTTEEPAGTLFWCDAGLRQEIEAQSIRMIDIADIYYGKHQPGLQKGSAMTVPDDHCFSITTNKRAINVECSSLKERDAWTTGIVHLLEVYRRRGIRVHHSDITRSQRLAITDEAVLARDIDDATKKRLEMLLRAGDGFLCHTVGAPAMPRLLVCTTGAAALNGEDAALQCYDSGLLADKERLPLADITDIFMGKTHVAFGSAQRVDPSCCLTILAGDASLHLEADDPVTRTNWVAGLTILARNANGGRRDIAVHPQPVLSLAQQAAVAASLQAMALANLTQATERRTSRFVQAVAQANPVIATSSYINTSGSGHHSNASNGSLPTPRHHNGLTISTSSSNLMPPAAGSGTLRRHSSKGDPMSQARVEERKAKVVKMPTGDIPLETVLANMQSMMETGAAFTQFTVRRERRITLFMARDQHGHERALYWCRADKRIASPDSCLSMDQITGIAIGKQTRAFTTPAAILIDPKFCFSLLGPKRSLHLRAATDKDRDAWVYAIMHVLKNFHTKPSLFASNQLAGNEHRFGEEDQKDDPIAFPDGASATTDSVSIASLLNRKGSMALLPGLPPVSPALTTPSSSSAHQSTPSLFAMSTGAASGPVTVGAGISLALPPPLLTERSVLPSTMGGMPLGTPTTKRASTPPVDDSPMIEGWNVTVSVKCRNLPKAGIFSKLNYTVAAFAMITTQAKYIDQTDPVDATSPEFMKPLVIQYYLSEHKPSDFRLAVYNRSGADGERLLDSEAVAFVMIKVKDVGESNGVELPYRLSSNNPKTDRVLQKNNASLILKLERREPIFAIKSDLKKLVVAAEDMTSLVGMMSNGRPMRFHYEHEPPMDNNLFLRQGDPRGGVGNLWWSQVGVPAHEDPERSIQLDTVTDIYLGAHFSAFDASSPSPHLLSIECKGGRRLDLEAPNVQLRDGWANGLMLLLKSHHIRVDLHQEGKLK